MSRLAFHQKKLSDIGEFGLIGRIKKEMPAPASLRCGIGDDTAVFRLSKEKYALLTTDMLVEGIHFTRQMPAKSVGYKAMAVNLSDIAAMGGTAQYAVVSLGVPLECSLQFVSRLYGGLKKAAGMFGVTIAGGDTVRSKQLVINVTLFGEVKHKHVVFRSGARLEDDIYVTGPLGRSLSSGRHLRFIPRIDQAQYLVKRHKPTSMIDISDGLVSDLGHILHESGVRGAVIEQELIPLRPKAHLCDALYDGEDFELLFTLSARFVNKLSNKNVKGFKFYRIGKIVGGKKGVHLRTTDGLLKLLPDKGYKHF